MLEARPVYHQLLRCGWGREQTRTQQGSAPPESLLLRTRCFGRRRAEWRGHRAQWWGDEAKPFDHQVWPQNHLFSCTYFYIIITTSRGWICHGDRKSMKLWKIWKTLIHMTKKYENMVQPKEPDFHTFSVSLSILLTHNRKSMKIWWNILEASWPTE